MKSVGIRVLKNKLSSYLKFVQSGEVVLITDRDEVIAEIRRPTLAHAQGRSEVYTFLDDCAARGVMTFPQSQVLFPSSSAELPKPPIEVSAAKLLEETREDRL